MAFYTYRPTKVNQKTYLDIGCFDPNLTSAIVLFHKIAAMIGLQEAIEKRCKKNDVIPKKSVYILKQCAGQWTR